MGGLGLGVLVLVLGEEGAVGAAVQGRGSLRAARGRVWGEGVGVKDLEFGIWGSWCAAPTSLNALGVACKQASVGDAAGFRCGVRGAVRPCPGMGTVSQG